MLIMAEDDLTKFRKRWTEELKTRRKEQRADFALSSSWATASGSDQDQKSSYFDDSQENSTEAEDEPRVNEEPGKEHWRDSEQPNYVCIAHGLLDGRTSPLLDRIEEEKTKRKRKFDHNLNSVKETQRQYEPPHRKDKKAGKLLDQLIQDLVGSHFM